MPCNLRNRPHGIRRPRKLPVRKGVLTLRVLHLGASRREIGPIGSAVTDRVLLPAQAELLSRQVQDGRVPNTYLQLSI